MHGDVVWWPLSWPQRGRLERDLTRGRAPYNVNIAFDVDGDIRASELRAALDQLIAAHPTLRARVADDGGGMHVLPTAAAPLTVAGGLPPLEIEVALGRQSGLRFDRNEAPMWTCALLVDTSGAQILAFTFDHLVMDGVSLGILLRGLSATNPTFGDPRGPTSYGAFAAQQQAMFEVDDAPALAYWREHLIGVPTNRGLRLPFGRNYDRPPSGRTTEVRLALTDSEQRVLRDRAARAKVTAFLWFLAAVAATLCALSGETDVTLRVVTHGRPVGFEETVGWFSNLVHVRHQVVGQPTFRDHVQRVREVWLRQLRHHTTPYDYVLRHVEPHLLIRDERPPVVTVNAPAPYTRVTAFDATLNVRPEPAGEGDEAGLHFQFLHDGRAVAVSCLFDVARYDAGDIMAVLAAVRDRMTACPMDEVRPTV
jgi:hypothetical protein